MSSRTSRNVSLTPALEKFIDGRVAAGHYQTASEVIREALRLMEEREREVDEAYDALKKKLRQRASKAKKGKFIDGEESLREVMSVFSKERRAPNE